MAFGTGSTLLGNGSEVSSAMQRSRFGDSVSPLSQVSQGSPFGSQNVMPIPASQLPSSPMPVSQVKQSQPKAPQTETEMILKALIGRLNTHNKAVGPQF